jgi:carnitine O-octanoyltransferase
MAQPLIVSSVGVEESRANRLKALAACCYHSGKFWELIRNEKLRPPTNPDKTITFSSDLFKRLFNTTRIPGETKDEIQSYFKTKSEGYCPATVLFVGKGRIFYLNFVENGEILSPQDFYYALMIIRDKLHNETTEKGIPILTCDERTSWYKNRKYLIELSKNNAEQLKIIESAAMTLYFDENEPNNYSEVSKDSLSGDFHSRWMDKSSAMISFENGKFGCIGEHSCYDGTISIAFSSFMLMSLMEEGEPDWSVMPTNKIIPNEIKFDMDDHLRSEIVRCEQFLSTVKDCVTAQCTEFTGYGKAVMKKQKVHPDCFVQMALQLAYFKIHGKLAPTYETATMRVFYHGRTETVRSCSIEVKEWLDRMYDDNVTVIFELKYVTIIITI